MRFSDVLLITTAAWLLLVLGQQTWAVIDHVEVIRAGGMRAVLDTAVTFAQSVVMGLLGCGVAFMVRLLERIEKKIS